MIKIKRSVKDANRGTNVDIVKVTLELSNTDYEGIMNSNTRVRGTLAAQETNLFDFRAYAQTKNAGNQNKQNKTQYAKTTLYKNGDVRFSVKVPKRKLEDFANIIDDELDAAVDFIEGQ